MSDRDYRMFLQDIMDSINKIEKYTQDLDFRKFKANEMIIDAVIRNIEIIGEATSNIPGKIQQKYPLLPWTKMKSMRNKVIHEYFGIDVNITWKTIKKSLPQLKTEISQVLMQENLN